MMIIEWLRKLFKKTTASESKLVPLKTKLKMLKTGDLVEIKLEKNFCAFAVDQPKLRFSRKELTERKIRGVVAYSSFSSEINCYVIDIQIIDNEFGEVRTKIVSVLQDEIEDVIIHE